MKKLLFLLGFFMVSFNVFALSDIQCADSAYNKEDYALAAELYLKLANEGVANADLWYNIGNSYYRCGKVGKAIIAYERALRLNPADEDARANLDFVNARIEDKPEDDTSFLSNVHKSILNTMSADSWAWVAVITFLLIVAAASLYIFSKNVVARKAGFFGGIVLILIFIYILVLAVESAARINDDSEAVVTVPTTLLNSVPRQPKQSEKVVPIHEGTKVRIIDSVATPDDPVSPQWYNVKINNSTQAWLRATDVEKI